VSDPHTASSLAKNCLAILSEKGHLAELIPGFAARQPQLDLCANIAHTIENQAILVAEAGTGTGKTFAYLLPCLLSGKKTLISTATKTLQDQLFHNDLPTLLKALGLPKKIFNLKGRANYVCEYRVRLHAEEGQFQHPEHAKDVLYVRERLSQMRHGDRAELPEIPEASPVWSYLTSTTDNCLGTQCPHFEDCFLVKARKKALEADLVIINHHLFFADSRLKEDGLGELLPKAEVIVFDEAHQLPEIAIHFHGETVSTRQFRELIDDLLHELKALEVTQQVQDLRQESDALMTELFQEVVPDRSNFFEVMKDDKLWTLWIRWLDLIAAFVEVLTPIDLEEHKGLKACEQQLRLLDQQLRSFNKDNHSRILWIERFKQSLAFHATPHDVAELFHALMQRQTAAYIFTSATLTMASSFDCFCQSLGLVECQTLLLESPFDFERQALLYIPRGLPDPKDVNYHTLLVAKMLPIIKACGGRCFFLFTSHKALKQVAQIIDNQLDYPLLIQGNEAKSILLARFKQLGNAVLLGTGSFWEGVDVKGDALSCVIIDKLPFANLLDPVQQGRMIHFKRRGLSAFNELSLPYAVTALKQGVGRLIRDAHDRGILIIADPRLGGRAYGQLILKSLPPLPMTRDEGRALQFIDQLVSQHESSFD
jgi:ATP-dependent DNA helicase DinG